MLDLDEFANRVEFTQRIEIPTDSVITEITANRYGIQVKKLYDVERILSDCEFFRKMNRENNGFTGLKHMRHIGRLPFHIFLQITKAADGDSQLEEKFTKKWLRHNREFMCVDNARSI